MLEDVGREIVDSAIRVHSALGPGLLESAYEACLAFELTSRGLRVERQVPMSLVYRDVTLDVGYRLDLLVEQAVVVELKVTESLAAVHEAQLLAYLKLGGWRLGYLLNFNTARMKDGIKRMVNGL